MGHSVCASLDWLIGATILIIVGNPTIVVLVLSQSVEYNEAEKEKRDGSVLNFFCLA